jgi:hypothetical protein
VNRLETVDVDGKDTKNPCKKCLGVVLEVFEVGRERPDNLFDF